MASCLHFRDRAENRTLASTVRCSSATGVSSPRSRSFFEKEMTAVNEFSTCWLWLRSHCRHHPHANLPPQTICDITFIATFSLRLPESPPYHCRDPQGPPGSSLPSEVGAASPEGCVHGEELSAAPGQASCHLPMVLPVGRFMVSQVLMRTAGSVRAVSSGLARLPSGITYSTHLN